MRLSTRRGEKPNKISKDISKNRSTDSHLKVRTAAVQACRLPWRRTDLRGLFQEQMGNGMEISPKRDFLRNIAPHVEFEIVNDAC